MAKSRTITARPTVSDPWKALSIKPSNRSIFLFRKLIKTVSPLLMETHLSCLRVFLRRLKTFAQNSLDSWMETSQMTNEPLIPSSPPPSVSPSSRLPAFTFLCASTSFFLITPSLLFSPPVSRSSLSFDYPFSQICYCHREMSHCFQPFQPPLPSFHPALPPTFPLHLRLLLLLCPSTAFESLLLSAETQFLSSLWPEANSLSLKSSPFLLHRLLFCHLFCFHLLLLHLLLLLLQRFHSCISNLALLSGAIMEVC